MSETDTFRPPGTPFDEASVRTLFDSFLEQLQDPDGGRALYALHAPDAPVRCGAGIAAACSITAEAFAVAHRDISRSGAADLPRFTAGPLCELQAAAPQAVAWFEVQEHDAPRHLYVALGVRAGTEDLRIVWCTPSEQILPWSFEDGLRQSLADYPWVRAGKPAAARALLDAGYFRRYWRPPLVIVTLPDARFSCQMSTACCRHDYEITLPPEAQLLIDALPWQRLAPQLVGTRLPVRADGMLQLKSPEETCRFLGADNHCRIHQVLGRQPFGACCVFPFSFARTPEGIAVGLSPICGSARVGLGIAPQERIEDLRERLIHAEPRASEVFRLTPERAILWEPFRDIEKGLCDCLAAQDLPLRRRLYVGARLLGALAEGGPIDVATWQVEPLPLLRDDLRAAIHGMLARLLGWNRAVLRELPRDIPADLAQREVREPAILAGILRNTLFCKVYSYPLDLTSAHNYLIVLYLLTLLMQRACDGPLPPRMWRELGSLGVHGLLKTMLNEGMPENFRTLLSRSEFGVWLLAA
ncbi:MAG: YkgJ family cysteine cluster protein [Steroidobacteraceae bacterium]